jgi:hypothetical protein
VAAANDTRVDVPRGIQWPLDDRGKRSTALAGQRILAEALRPLDGAAADDVLVERDWRHRYPRHLKALVSAQAARPAAVVASSRAGIDAAWRAFEFVGEGGQALPLAQAMAQPGEAVLATVSVQGQGDAVPARWEVPYRGKRLHGDALLRQIDRWQREHIAEPGHCDALRRLVAHPEWFDLSDRRIVLLGAGSEAGPLGWLARWRAQILALDLPRPAVWKRIAATVAVGNARLLAPAATGTAGDDIAHAGADMGVQTPALARWLLAQQAEGAASAASATAPLDIGCIAYADGERHVRVTLAMDALAQACCAADARTTLAFMATPTDVFAVPEGVAREIMAAWSDRSLLKRMTQASLRAGSGARSFFSPHIESLVEATDGSRWGVVDALVVEQGPNYALAKRLQQWRAHVARAGGHRVVHNVAPSTTTASVVSNPVLAAGFRGAKAFDVEVFEPATTNALMAGLWVHDLRHGAPGLAAGLHPLAPLAASANHGGLWRAPYLPRSVLPLAALLGMVKRG